MLESYTSYGKFLIDFAGQGWGFSRFVLLVLLKEHKTTAARVFSELISESKRKLMMILPPARGHAVGNFGVRFL